MSPALLAKTAAGQFTTLKRKKAPGGAGGEMSRWTPRRRAAVKAGTQKTRSSSIPDPTPTNSRSSAASAPSASCSSSEEEPFGPTSPRPSRN